MKSVGIAVISLCFFLPAAAQDRDQTITTTVTEFRIKQLPKDQVDPNGRIGTTVLLELFNETEGKLLTGAQIDPNKITFTDSTGRDLFAAGKKARLEYDKTNQTFGGMLSVENMLSINPPGWVGRDKVKPGAVYLRCHALATPAREAAGVRIKGEIDIFTDTDETKTITLTKKQLISRKGFEVAKHSMKLVGCGGGVGGGRSYRSYELDSVVRLKKISVVGKLDLPSPVVLVGHTLKIYGDEIEETDKIEVTYSLPKKSTLELDLEVTPGSVGR